MGFIKSIFSPPKSKVQIIKPPPADDATDVMRRETKRRDRAREGFHQRQRSLGPVQLQVPTLKL